MKRCLTLLLLLCALLPGARAQSGTGMPRLVLADPFVELHTGPGRGYPVFHVAARGEAVELLLAHTQWIQLRTDGGQVGWATRDSLQGTLAGGGWEPGLLRRWTDRHLRDRLELGARLGRFQGQPLAEMGLRWQLSPAIEIEAVAGQVQGLYSGTDYWRLGLALDPMNEQALAPTFALGVGRLHNVPNASLVEQGITNANLAHAGLGLRWRFGGRWRLRAEWSHHLALLSEQRSREYRALSLGLAFTF